MPKESYTQTSRKKIQAILCQNFKALNVEFTTYFGESFWCEHFVLRTNPNQTYDYDLEALKCKIVD